MGDPGLCVSKTPITTKLQCEFYSGVLHQHHEPVAYQRGKCPEMLWIRGHVHSAMTYRPVLCVLT